MTYVATKRVSCLLIVRLNNYRSIRAAYGEEVAQGAMAHLRTRIAPQFSTMAVAQSGEDEIELVIGDVLPDPLPFDMLVDALCASVGADPYRCGDEAIILSVSAGCGALRDSLSSAETHEQGRDAARAQLAASSCKPDSFVQWGAAWANLYRADMATGVQLLEQVYKSETFFSWQSVRKVADLATILHYEGHLCRIGERGQRIDCEEAYKALERLELAYLVDQYLVSRVLDELDADPQARICVPVSAQSLSFNMYGKGAGWTELRMRLSNNRALAKRLVIEVAETSPLPSLPEAQDFVAELREMGAYIGLSRFGAGFASVGQLLSLTPDIVKLDSAFLRTAFESDRHRARIGHLIGLARTIGRVVIVDGVDSARFFELAEEQGAEWVVGTHMGNLSLTRAWLVEDLPEPPIPLAQNEPWFEMADRAARLEERVA